MVRQIAATLSEIAPAHADTFAANAAEADRRLITLSTEVTDTVAPVRQRPFVVFHDAYQYFEARFGLSAAGSITVTPDIAPGVAHLAEVQAKVRELEAACVFSEPQFEPRLVNTVIDGTAAKSGELDPLGAEVPSGPGAYGQILRDMAASFRRCLTPAS